MASDTSVVFNLLAKDKASAVVKSTAQKIGTAAAAAGAAGAGALAVGMVSGLQAEAVTDKVAASLGLTPAQQEASGSAASKVFAGAYASNMDEAGAAVGAVMSSIEGMRSASDTEIAAMTETALNYAKTFDTDVNEAVSSAGVLIKTGLAGDATEAFDLMTAASQQVPAAMRADMLEASNEYSKHLAGLGFSGQEAFGVLATAAEGGSIALDKSGDALKEFSLRSTDMSATSTAAYKTLGMDAETMAAKILAGGDTAKSATQDIATGLLGIKDPVQQANTAIALFGTPLEDMSVDQIPAFLQSLSGTAPALANVEGAAARMGDTLNDNTATRIQSLQNTMQVWLQDLAGAPGPIGAVSSATMAFGGTALTAGSQIGMMAMALGQSGTAGKIAAKGAKVAAIGVRGVGIAMRFATGPIGLVITGLALLAAGLIYAYRHNARFRAIVQTVMRAVSTAFKGMLSTVKTVFGWLRSSWPAVQAVITMPIRRAVAAVRSAIGIMVGTVRSAKSRISGAASGMWDGITRAFKGAINAIIAGWNRLSFGIPGFNVGPVHYGGFSMSPPRIPYLAKGGIVTSATLAMIGEGRGPEAVIPLDRAGQYGFGGGPVVLQVAGGSGDRMEAMLVELIRRFVRVRGRGDVQTAFGR